MTPDRGTEDRPLRADARRNRARLLDAADQVFAHEGLDAGIDAIAARAGVGVGTVYRHFPTKDALFEAVMNHRFARLVDRARALATTDDPTAALDTCVREIVATAHAQRGLFDALGPTAPNRQASPSVGTDLFAAVGAILLAAQAAGTIRPDVTPDDMKALIVGIKSADDLGGDVDRLLDVMLAGLRTS